MVDPELKECVGVGPMQCMVVDGELFYSRIDGFDYEEQAIAWTEMNCDDS